MAAEGIVESAKKIPVWVWGGALVVAAGIVWFQSRGASSATSTTTTDQPPGQGPGGTTCPTYPIPDCASQGEQLIWGQDGTGCPLPTCAPSSGSGHSCSQGGPYYVTTDGTKSLSQIQYIQRCWGDDTILAYNLATYPSLAHYGLFHPVPAGLKLRVG